MGVQDTCDKEMYIAASKDVNALSLSSDPPREFVLELFAVHFLNKGAKTLSEGQQSFPVATFGVHVGQW